MATLKYGSHSGCTRCGQDIEWWGKAKGWVDRGGNRECPPYLDINRVLVVPKGLKHTTKDKGT